MTPIWWILAVAMAAETAKELPEGEPPVAEEEVPLGPERSLPPAVIPANWIALDEPTVHEIDGATVWHVRVPGVRKVGLALTVFRGTHELDGWPTEVAQAVGMLGDIATADRDPVALEIIQDLHDVSVVSWISDHAGGVQLSVPLEDLELGLGLAREVLHQPVFPKKDIAQHLREKALYLTVDGPNSLSRVAWATVSYAWYPADHVYGARPDLAQLKRLKAADIAEKHATWRTSGPVAAVVVGDVAWADLEPGLTRLLEGVGAPGERAPELEVAVPSASRVVAVDMPGQSQTALRLRYEAPPKEHEDRAAFEAMNWAFGGHFLSRLNANLREDKGFTYGAGSSFSSQDTRGSLTVHVDVKSENTGEAIREIQGEIARLVEGGVTTGELDMARQTVVSDWNGTRETASSALRFYSWLLRDQLSVADALGRERAVESLDRDGIMAVAERWLGSDQPHLWVVVGDRKAVQPQLEELGLTAEWISPQRAILGDL